MRMDAALRPYVAVDPVDVTGNVSPTCVGVADNAPLSVSACLNYLQPYCPIEPVPDRVIFLYGIRN